MRYQKSDRARDFVLDLLFIRVNQLLAIVPGDDEAADAEVQENFKRSLQDFIRRNALNRDLLSKMNNIMVRFLISRLHPLEQEKCVLSIWFVEPENRWLLATLSTHTLSCPVLSIYLMC